MPTNVKVKDLKINKLTEAQYDAAVQAGTIGENELSILTDMVEKTIQVDTMPTADASELDNIYQYVGETSQFYTNGYFYKCSGSAERSATASQTEGSGLTNIVVDIDAFETQITASGSYDFVYDEWENSWMFHSSPANLANYGITYTGTPADYDTITVIYSPGGGYVWNQVNVQPSTTPIITISTSTVVQALASNYVYDCGEMTSIEVTLPGTLTANFASQMNFTSGTTATTFTAPSSVIWVGDNVSETVGFVPRANCRYTIVFMYDGINVRGIVQGISL